MPQTRHGDRIVVTGYSAGSHYPRVQAELAEAWEANGRGAAGAFAVDGSIYGRDLRFVGSGQVHGSILGRGDVLLDATNNEKQLFLSGISTSGNLVVKRFPAALTESCNADFKKHRHFIRGDVLGNRIRLEHCVVFGNIEGAYVDLRSCLVFGSVVASDKLVCRASTLLCYHASEVEFEGPCLMLNALGSSVERPVFSPYEDHGGKIWPCTVGLYPILRAYGYAHLWARPWETQSLQSKGLLAPEADWVEVPVALPNDDIQSRHVLSIARRALNFSSLKEHLAVLCKLLRTGLEFVHYKPELQRELAMTWDTLPDDERLLMRHVADLE